MAISRALLTTAQDFQIIDHTKAGYKGLDINNPLIYYNAETDPISTELQTGSIAGSKTWYPATRPTADKFVDGIRGKALKHDKARYYTFVAYHFPASTKYQMSLFFKPTAADIAATFAIIATNRGLGFSNTGFHIALNTGVLDLRVYGTDGTSLLTGTSGASNGYPKFTFVADQWYHVAVMYDGANNTIEVLINGETQVYVAVVPKFPSSFERAFTIGDMPNNSTSISTNAFSGVIDEVFYLYGDNSLTREQYLSYYDTMINRRLLDDKTEIGSLQLPRLMDGTYRAGTVYGWESEVKDIGDPPIDYYSRLHMNALMDNEFHSIRLYTRTSDDGITFDAFREVAADGKILSPSKRYYQIRAELATFSNLSTPVLKELEILEYEKPINYSLQSEPLRVYKDLETGIEPMGILNNAYEIWIEEEVKAKELLTFNLPMNDPKRKQLGKEAVEYLLEIGNRRYILKENNDVKGSGGKKISGFKAEAKWYELNDVKVPEYELVEASVEAHIAKALNDCVPATTWKVIANVSTVTKLRTIRGTWKSVLMLIRDIESTFGVEIYFDTSKDEITIMDQIGTSKKIRFYHSKNLKEIERHINTYGMVTRLYPYGAGQLDISTVNPQGLDYIENLTWVNKLGLRNKIRPDTWKDDRYTIPQNLIEDSTIILEEMSKPNISYKMGLLDLSSRTGHEPEAIFLGDTVSVVDEDLLDEELPSRIMRRKYNVREPQKTEVELDQPRKELADAKSRSFDDDIQTLTESDPLSAGDIKEMAIFNHLLNSRADSGLLEWTNVGSAGITATAEGGFSGDNSFKIEAGYGEFKSIRQEVFNISHRSTYTVSALVNKTGNITAGANGFVGIRIKVRYRPDENGVVKEEIKLLKLPDVTNMIYDDEV